MREVVLDTETTGIDHSEGHRVVSIGCVEIVDGLITGREAEWFCNPRRKSDPRAFQVHGLSDAFLARQPEFYMIVDEFLAFIAGATLVAHNASFDIGHLNAEFKRMASPPPPLVLADAVDTLKVARKKHNATAGNSLDALKRRYRVHVAREKHGALLDAKILAVIYGHIRPTPQEAMALTPDLFQAFGGADEADIYATRRPNRSRLTSAERDGHAALVKTLGDDKTPAIWGQYLK